MSARNAPRLLNSDHKKGKIGQISSKSSIVCEQRAHFSLPLDPPSPARGTGRGTGGDAFKHGIATVPVSWAGRTPAGAWTRSLLAPSFASGESLPSFSLSPRRAVERSEVPIVSVWPDAGSEVPAVHRRCWCAVRQLLEPSSRPSLGARVDQALTGPLLDMRRSARTLVQRQAEAAASEQPTLMGY
jgi:hypothetical protein